MGSLTRICELHQMPKPTTTDLTNCLLSHVIMANAPDYSAIRRVLAEYSLKEIMGLIKTGQLLPADFPIIAYYQDGTPLHL